MNNHNKTTLYRLLLDHQESWKLLSGKGSGETVMTNNITSNHVLKSGRVPTTVVGNIGLKTLLTHGYLMMRNDQHPMYPNVACRNSTWTIKHCLVKCPHWRDTRKKCILQSDIKTIQGIYCEMEKKMKFHEEMVMFDEIQKWRISWQDQHYISRAL